MNNPEMENTEPSLRKPEEGVTTIPNGSSEQVFAKNHELTKICEVCKSEFDPKKKEQTCCSKKCYSKKWRTDNLEHRKNYKKEYYHTGNVEYKAHCDFKSSLWMYTMSIEQYNELLKNQEGHCALCENQHDANGYRLHVDHDHKCCDTRGRKKTCGKCNRGLLCGVCNRKLGFLEKFLQDINLVEAKQWSWVFKALQYISKYEVKM